MVDETLVELAKVTKEQVLNNRQGNVTGAVNALALAFAVAITEQLARSGESSAEYYVRNKDLIAFGIVESAWQMYSLAVSMDTDDKERETRILKIIDEIPSPDYALGATFALVDELYGSEDMEEFQFFCTQILDQVALDDPFIPTQVIATAALLFLTARLGQDPGLERLVAISKEVDNVSNSLDGQSEGSEEWERAINSLTKLTTEDFSAIESTLLRNMVSTFSAEFLSAFSYDSMIKIFGEVENPFSDESIQRRKELWLEQEKQKQLKEVQKEIKDLKVQERARKKHEKEKQGTCFVATAALGTPHHPDISVLRAFRDDCLLESAGGRIFVSLYNTIGPSLASVIRKQPVLKKLALCTVVRPGVWIARTKLNRKNQLSD